MDFKLKAERNSNTFGKCVKLFCYTFLFSIYIYIYIYCIIIIYSKEMHILMFHMISPTLLFENSSSRGNNLTFMF